MLLGVAVAAVLITILQSSRALLIGGLPFHLVALLLAFGLGAWSRWPAPWCPPSPQRGAPLDALRPSQQPGRTLGGRLPWVIGLVIAAVAVGVVAYPLQRGDASLSGAPLAWGSCWAAPCWWRSGSSPSPLIGRPFAALFGAQGELGRANLGRDPVRTGLTVGALAIGSPRWWRIVTASARATADVWVRSILPGGYAIRLTVADDIDFVGRPGDHPRRRSGHAHQRVPRGGLTGDVQREVGVAGIGPSDFQDTSLIFVAGDRRDASTRSRDGGAVLVPESLAGRRPGRWRHHHPAPAARGSRSPSPGSWPTRCRPRGPRAPS